MERESNEVTIRINSSSFIYRAQCSQIELDGFACHITWNGNFIFQCALCKRKLNLIEYGTQTIRSWEKNPIGFDRKTNSHKQKFKSQIIFKSFQWKNEIKNALSLHHWTHYDFAPILAINIFESFNEIHENFTALCLCDKNHNLGLFPPPKCFNLKQRMPIKQIQPKKELEEFINPQKSSKINIYRESPWIGQTEMKKNIYIWKKPNFRSQLHK